MAERSVVWRITTSFAKARKDSERLADSLERLEDQREELDSNSVEGNRRVTRSSNQRSSALSEMARQSKKAAAAEKANAAATEGSTTATRNSAAATRAAAQASRDAAQTDQQRLASSKQLTQIQQRLAQAELSRSRATLSLAAAQQRLSAIEKKHGADSEQHARGLLALQRRQLDLDASSQRYIIALGKANDEQNALSGSADAAKNALGGLLGVFRGVAGQASAAITPLNGIASGLTKIGFIAPSVAGGVGFLIAAISNLTAGLTSMVGPLLSTASALAALPQMLSVGAGAIGTFIGAFSGIGEALKAGGAAQKDAGAAAKGNADAHRNAARAIRNALWALRDAHEAYAEALENEKDAQKAITQARRDARRELEDMNDALEDMALQQRGASLSVEEARRRLEEVNLNPASDDLSRAQAQLAYDEALERMDDVRRESERAKKDTAKANKKGVEGSDQVVDALEAHEDAIRAVRNAQEGIIRAEEALADARRASVTSTNAAASAADKYAEALKNLSPAGQRFVKTLLGMRDEMKRLKFAAQEGLLPGLGEALTTLLKLVPLAEKGLFMFGQTMANTAKKGADLLTSDEFMPMWSRLLTSNNKVLKQSGDAFLNLIEAVVYLMDAARPFTEWLSETILGWTEYWSEIAKAGNETGKTADKLEKVKERLTTFGSILKNLWQTFKNIGGAGSELGDDLWQSFDRITKGWADWTGSIEGQNSLKEWFDASRGPLEQMSKILGGLTRGFFEIGKSGSDNLTRILKTVRELGPPLLDMFLKLVEGDYLPTLTDALVNFGIALANVMPAVADAITPIAEAIADVAGWLSKVSEGEGVQKFAAFVIVAASLGTALRVLSFVFKPLISLLSGFGKVMSKVFTFLNKFKIVRTIATNLRFLWAIIGAASGPVALVVGAIGALVGVFVYLWKASDTFRKFWKDLWNGISSAVSGAIKPVGDALKKELDKWSGLWDPFKKSTANIWKLLKPIVYGIGASFVAIGGVIGNVLKRILPPLIKGLGFIFVDLLGVVRNTIGFLVKLFSGDFKGALKDFAAIWGNTFEAIWHLIEGVGKAIFGVVWGIVESVINFFKYMYDVLVGHSIVPDLMKAIVWWFKFVAKVAVPIIKKAIHAVLAIFKFVFPIILKLVKAWWAGVKIVFNLIKGIITNVVAPALKILWNIFKTAFTIIRGLVILWWRGVQTYFGLLKGLFEKVVWPVLQWLWDRFKWVFKKIVDGAKVYIAIFKKIWSKIKDWIIDPIVKAWPKIKEAWETIKNAFKKAFDFVKNLITTVWSKIKDWIINPIQKAWDKIKPILENIKEGFRVMKDKVSGWMSALSTAIGKVWDGIGNVVRGGANLAIKVINLLVDTYNATIGKIPGVDDLSHMAEIKPVGGARNAVGNFAKGGIPSASTTGVYPGYTPGRDIGYIGISGGEAIMRPEWTRAIGSGAVHEMNRVARTEGVSGLRKRFHGGFASGGIPAIGAWNRHASGYAFPAYDINIPGSVDYGNPVKAYKDGTVSSVIYLGDRSYGRYIRINHSDNTETLYAHLSAANVAPGQAVKRGQVIGKVGDLGDASGPHLHFEIRGGSSAIQPFSGDIKKAGVSSSLGDREKAIVGVLKKIFTTTPTLGGLEKYFGKGTEEKQKATKKYEGGFISGFASKIGMSSLVEMAKSGWNVINPAKLSKKALEALGSIGKNLLSGAGNLLDKGAGILGLNKGGRVPGVGNKDTVPAMLTPGEFVMNKRATAQIGVSNLAALNGGSGGTESGGVSYYHSGGYVGNFKPGASGNFVKALEYLTGLPADGKWDATLTNTLRGADLNAPAYLNDKSSDKRNAKFVKWVKNSKNPPKWKEAKKEFGLSSPQLAHWYTELQSLLVKKNKKDKDFVKPKQLEKLNTGFGKINKKMTDSFGSLNTSLGLPASATPWPGYPVSYAGGTTKTALDHALAHVFSRPHDQFAFRPWASWTPTEGALITQIAANDRREKWVGAMTTLSSWGLTDLVNDLTGKGPMDDAGFNVALDAVKNRSMATQLNEQLRIAGSISDEDMNNLIKLIAFLNLNPDGKGLRDIARHLGLTDFQTVRLWENASGAGRLSGVSSGKQSRMNTDVASYRAGTFYANTGGQVPGSGNTDTVPAMLTPGEFVIRKEAAKALGIDNLWALNAAHYNTGGLVGAMAPKVNAIPSKASVGVSSRAISGGGVVYNVNNNYDIDINNPVAEPSTRSMMKALQRQSVLGKGGSTVVG